MRSPLGLAPHRCIGLVGLAAWLVHLGWLRAPLGVVGQGAWAFQLAYGCMQLAPAAVFLFLALPRDSRQSGMQRWMRGVALAWLALAGAKSVFFGVPGQHGYVIRGFTSAVLFSVPGFLDGGDMSWSMVLIGALLAAGLGLQGSALAGARRP